MEAKATLEQLDKQMKGRIISNMKNCASRSAIQLHLREMVKPFWAQSPGSPH